MELAKTEWISGIDTNKKREAEIQSSFSNETEVHIAKEPEEPDSLIKTFKLRSEAEDNEKDTKNVKNLFGENKKMDRLLVIDDVSGVADISKKNFNCVKKIWLSLRLCVSCNIAFYSNLAKNNFTNKHF